MTRLLTERRTWTWVLEMGLDDGEKEDENNICGIEVGTCSSGINCKYNIVIYSLQYILTRVPKKPAQRQETPLLYYLKQLGQYSLYDFIFARKSVDCSLIFQVSSEIFSI